MKTLIRDRLAHSLALATRKFFPQDKVKITLDHPLVSSHGDYSTNLALTIARELGQKPLSLAHDLKEELLNDPDPIWDSVTVAGPGFINFLLKKELLAYEIQNIVSEADGYCHSPASGTKILVEFAHPNTHKQFHIGHLRNITLGESLVRLLEAGGNTVIRANYQGDVGMHVAKAMWGIKQDESGYFKVKTASLKEKVEFLARAYVAGNQAFESDPAAKEQIVRFNKQIYHQDRALSELWQETRRWSLEYFDGIYKRLDSTFDRFYFESEVADRGKEIVLRNVGKIFEKSEGAIVYRGEKVGLHTRVFINSEGNPTYEAKDVGLAELQFKEHQPDLIIHNVGPEQTGYFQVIFAAIADVFPKTKGKEQHLAYGWVKLKEGKMSSRTGNVVLGEWLLDEIKKRLDEKYSDRMSDLEAVAIGAAKYSLLKVGTGQEIAFDIDESIALDGDSGPYLQYTYARARSVLGKREKIEDRLSKVGVEDRELKVEEIALLRYLYRFPEVVEAAAKTYSPNLICSYLFDLAKRFNNFYNSQPILGSKEEQFRLTLTQATSIVLKNGLKLLGIKPLERM